MRDEVYVGSLISSESLQHSAKGSTWKKHKYIAIINGVYQYPKRKMAKYRARQQAPELAEKYTELSRQYGNEAAELSYEATLARQQADDEDRRLRRASREREMIPVDYQIGNKSGRTYIESHSSPREDLEKELYWRNHRGYRDGDTGPRDTISDSPRSKARHKERLAKSRQYMANNYAAEAMNQKLIASDRDIVDKGIDFVMGVLGKKKKKKSKK